ncbi:MAG: epoxyqueuosine reductase QueH [Thermodesulfobacteriota bacterium]
MGRILVHICCGPCAIYPVKEILKGKLEVWGYFFNPNIHPREEFRKRLDAVRTLAEKMSLPVICNDEYSPELFFRSIPGPRKHETPRAERCARCYSLRLDRTADAARKRGFDFFSSSLLYSKYQDHETIISAGLDMEHKYGVPFYYDDFRPGWKEGITHSREMGLYRQNYCGCVYSKKERGLF